MHNEEKLQHAIHVTESPMGHDTTRNIRRHSHAGPPNSYSSPIVVDAHQQQALHAVKHEEEEGNEGEDEDQNSIPSSSQLLPPEPLALPMLPGNPNSKVLAALRGLPALRRIVYRPGRGFSGPGRAGNHEATIGTCVGSNTQVACGHCQSGGGIFAECIVVLGYFKGACTNCHFNSEGTRCSFRRAAGLTDSSSASSPSSVTVVPVASRAISRAISADPTTASASPISPVSPASLLPPNSPTSSTSPVPQSRRRRRSIRRPLPIENQLPDLMREAKAMSWGQRREKRARLELELSAISWAESWDMLEEEQRVLEERK